MAIKVKRLRGESTRDAQGNVVKEFSASTDDIKGEATLVEGQIGFERVSGNLKINDGGEIKDVIKDIKGNAKTASALTSNAGNASTPVFFNDGKPIATTAKLVFDRVITNQAEFNELLASPDWFGAVSVAFVGEFVSDTSVKIPQTVKQIQGFNSAKIAIPNFIYSGFSALGGLWYKEKPTTPDYSISDISIDCSGDITNHAFARCINLTRCKGNSTADSSGSESIGVGFYQCEMLEDCYGRGYGEGSNSDPRAKGKGYGYLECKQITCSYGEGVGSGFHGTYYANGYGYGFSNCEQSQIVRVLV